MGGEEERKRDTLEADTREQAIWHAKRIGAHRYMECSARTGQGVDALLEEAGGEAARRAVERSRMVVQGEPIPADERDKPKNKRRRFF